MARIDVMMDWVAGRITSHVMCMVDPERTPTHRGVEQLQRTLQIGDVVLVDGCDRVSAAIRYFTQSSWSHAALYVGAVPGTDGADGRPHALVEMVLGEGCVSSSLDKYREHPVRICRPTGLDATQRARVAAYVIERIGLHYDTRNVLDLARYLLPELPVPRRLRRRMLSLGSGDPTRAICSTLIAQAFQSVSYPILPRIERAGDHDGPDGYTREEIYHIRHHSLFAPRDFDLSPYFEIVKPTLADGFDPSCITWADGAACTAPSRPASRPNVNHQESRP